MITEKSPNLLQHLYWRAGFGPPASKLRLRASLPDESELKNEVDELFRASDTIQTINLVDKSLLPQKDFKLLSKEEKQKLKKEATEYTKQLNSYWLNQMSTTNAVLREKMTLFWHGHFACRSQNPYFLQELNNIHRANALGKFRDLLLAVSKSAAMLEFLNNQQNKKLHPNENFAREVMELFTVGRGHYTEDDIKEAARAFTGWGFDKKGEFVFRVNQHDYDSKTVLGKTGNFSGEDILDMLLENKATAKFLVTKIYKFFVNDDILNPNSQSVHEKHITTLSESFYASGYDIAALMFTIFNAPWFYSERNIGSKIKSPIELLVAINRTFLVTYEDPNVELYIQRVLGQELFFPPNVSGWAGGKNYIDSSSLIIRMKLGAVILNGGIIEQDPKDVAEDYAMLSEMRKAQDKLQRKVKAHPDWNYFITQLNVNPISKQAMQLNTKQLAEFLLQTSPPAILQKQIVEIENNTEALKQATLEIISLPEYQLC